MPAEILHDAGFRTFAIWRNGWLRPAFGFSQGFEVYHSPRATPIPASVRRERPSASIIGTDQDTAFSAMEFLRSHADERWFLYLHLMDVHQYVYDADSARFGDTYSDIYDNSIHWTDRVLGSVIGQLDARGLREKTLIVLAADHGEAFGEHGREGHARDVYGEVTTTPLILSFPFRLEPGLVVDGELVVLRDNRPDFHSVMGRIHAKGESRIRGLAATQPASLVVFDLLYRAGKSLMDLGLEARRAQLAELVAAPRRKQDCILVCMGVNVCGRFEDSVKNLIDADFIEPYDLCSPTC